MRLDISSCVELEACWNSHSTFPHFFYCLEMCLWWFHWDAFICGACNFEWPQLWFPGDQMHCLLTCLPTCENDIYTSSRLLCFNDILSCAFDFILLAFPFCRRHAHIVESTLQECVVLLPILFVVCPHSTLSKPGSWLRECRAYFGNAWGYVKRPSIIHAQIRLNTLVCECLYWR